MSTKLLVTALVALSVSALEENLAEAAYTADELAEALTLEKAGDNRKTAVAALEGSLAALEDATDQLDGAKVRVCKGKSITTAAGIKTGGDVITDGMLPADSITKLIEKDYLEVVA